MMIGKNKCIALLLQAKSQRKCILLFTEVFNNLMVVTTTRFAHLCPQHDHKIFMTQLCTMTHIHDSPADLSLESARGYFTLNPSPKNSPKVWLRNSAKRRTCQSKATSRFREYMLYCGSQATPVEVQNYSICLFNFRVTQNQQSFMLPLFDIFWLLQILCCAYHKNSAPVLGFIKTVYLQVGIRTLF